MCEIGYCSLVTFHEVFFQNVVHRNPRMGEIMGDFWRKACYSEQVNSNTEMGFYFAV